MTLDSHFVATLDMCTLGEAVVVADITFEVEELVEKWEAVATQK